jgi:sulfite reductase beta subunit-like hemoprotein
MRWFSRRRHNPSTGRDKFEAPGEQQSTFAAASVFQEDLGGRCVMLLDELRDRGCISTCADPQTSVLTWMGATAHLLPRFMHRQRTALKRSGRYMVTLGTSLP